MKDPGRFIASCAAFALTIQGACAKPASPGGRGLACPVTESIAIRRMARAFQGVLSRSCGAVTYSFMVAPGSILAWTYHGPAARFILETPDGSVEGPGLTSPIRLTQGGPYRFSLSSNGMAEGIYGPYKIRFLLR